MRALLLGIASLAVILPAPAAADSRSGTTFTVGSGGGNHGGFDRRDGRRHRGNDDGVFIYEDYREYQGDSLWRSDSFNDWWHDRPDRAYPRWMLNNQNCEKRWYQGDVLKC